ALKAEQHFTLRIVRPLRPDSTFQGLDWLAFHERFAAGRRIGCSYKPGRQKASKKQDCHRSYDYALIHPSHLLIRIKKIKTDVSVSPQKRRRLMGCAIGFFRCIGVPAGSKCPILLNHLRACQENIWLSLGPYK